MRIFIPLPGNETLAADLARLSSSALGTLETRHFPDGESLFAPSLAPMIRYCG